MLPALILLTTPVWLGSPVHAGDRDQAELDRLVEDINRFAERQTWSGVERRYEQLLALDDVEVPRDVHLHAAHAARASGHMDATLDRLQRAAKLKRTDEVDGWILDINENYGRVTLATVPPRSVEMVAELMPLAADQRQAILTGMKALNEDGEFVGMLPAGKYTLAGREFEVVPGVGTTVELSAKELRAERKRNKGD